MSRHDHVHGSRHHLAAASGLGLAGKSIRQIASETKGINAKTAVLVPAVLGSMPFFWFCVVLAVSSLPAVLTAFDSEVLKHALGLSSFFPAVIIKVSLIALVAWLAQTFIQLVALPVLQVASNATQAQAESNTHLLLEDGEATREHTEAILRSVDTTEENVAEGLTKLIDDRHQELLNAINKITS